ncbi:ferric reductase-like transmembrane domain-containing protein [Planotetraspora sp. GP83]|uniref:ferredoxin reductase family protein n=1 Tax=Planotetraspora sp. GP83 TaxID=3156264 RepID=UPI003517FDFC
MGPTDLTGAAPPVHSWTGTARASMTWRWPALLWSGAAAVLASWAVHAHGDLASAPVTAVGRLTGLLAGYLIAIQLILMSRAPDTRIVSLWHRRLGGMIFTLVCAHIVFTTMGYAAGAGLAGQTMTFIESYPWLLAAYAGTALLVMAGLTSVRAIKRRLRYETWYYLHLYAYLGTALAFAHTITISTDIVGAAKALWLALYGTALAMAVWRRIARPVALAARHGFRVSRVVRETPDVTSIHIGGRRMREFAARPGQFVRLRFLTREGWWQAHPFSLSAAPDGCGLRVTVKALGDHTRELRSVPVGTRVLVDGPYGGFTAASRLNDKVLMIAAGIGITPIRALLEEMPPGTVVVYRARSEKEVVFRDELDELARTRGAQLVYLLGEDHLPDGNHSADGNSAGGHSAGGHSPDGDHLRGGDRHLAVGTSGHRRVTEALTAPGLARLVPDMRSRDVFLCGPPGLVRHLRAELRKAGLLDRHVHVDCFEL